MREELVGYLEKERERETLARAFLSVSARVRREGAGPFEGSSAAVARARFACASGPTRQLEWIRDARARAHRAALELRVEVQVKQRHSVGAFCKTSPEKGRGRQSKLTPTDRQTDRPPGKVGWGQRVDALTGTIKVFPGSFSADSRGAQRNVRPVTDRAISPALL